MLATHTKERQLADCEAQTGGAAIKSATKARVLRLAASSISHAK